MSIINRNFKFLSMALLLASIIPFGVSAGKKDNAALTTSSSLSKLDGKVMGHDHTQKLIRLQKAKKQARGTFEKTLDPTIYFTAFKGNEEKEDEDQLGLDDLLDIIPKDLSVEYIEERSVLNFYRKVETNDNTKDNPVLRIDLLETITEKIINGNHKIEEKTHFHIYDDAHCPVSIDGIVVPKQTTPAHINLSFAKQSEKYESKEKISQVFLGNFPKYNKVEKSSSTPNLESLPLLIDDLFE